jgi:hypothetical protein
MRDKQFNYLWRQLQVTLETVNPFTVLHYLVRTTFAERQDFACGVNPGISLCQWPTFSCCQTLKQRVRLARICEPDGKFADLFFRAVAKRGPQPHR